MIYMQWSQLQFPAGQEFLMYKTLSVTRMDDGEECQSLLFLPNIEFQILPQCICTVDRNSLVGWER